MKKAAQRREYMKIKQREHNDKRRSRGLVTMTLWVKPEHKEAVKNYAALLEELDNG